MSDSESDDDLLPHQLGRREIGHHFFSDSDDDDEVRDYTSDDASSLASFGSGPLNDIDDELDEDSSPPDGHISEDLAPNQDHETAMEVDPALPHYERQEIDETAARKGRSPIADHLFINKDICLLSLDLEHGGEYCGILQ